MTQIILHTNDETVLRFRLLQIIETSLHHSRSEVLTSETNLSTNNRSRTLQLIHRSNHIQIQRLTRSSILSATIQYTNALACLRDSGIQMLLAEGTEQMYFHYSHLLSVSIQILHSLLHSRTSTHHHNHTISIGSSSIIKQMVLTTCDTSALVHSSLDLIRTDIIIGLSHNTVLHVDILRLGNTTLIRMIRIQSTLAEVISSLIRIDLCHLLTRNTVDGVHLMRHSPSIEVKEGNTCSDS